MGTNNSNQSESAARLSTNLAVSESGFVFMPTTGETFTVNQVGRIILQDLQAGRTPDEIIGHVSTQFEVDRKLVERDLADFLAQLKHFHLLIS